MNKITKGIILGSLVLPAFAFAQAQVNNVTDLINAIGGIINQVVPLIFAFTFVYFIWNLMHFIQGGTAGDAAKRQVAMDNIIWSIVAMFVMISVWGLVGILKGTFVLNPVSTKDIKPF